MVDIDFCRVCFQYGVYICGEVGVRLLLIGFCLWVGVLQGVFALEIGPLGSDVLLRDIAVEIQHGHPNMNVAQIMYAIADSNRNVFKDAGIFMPQPGQRLYIPNVDTINNYNVRMAEHWLVQQVALAPIPTYTLPVTVTDAALNSYSKQDLYTYVAKLEQDLSHLIALESSISQYQQSQPQGLGGDTGLSVLPWSIFTQSLVDDGVLHDGATFLLGIGWLTMVGDQLIGWASYNLQNTDHALRLGASYAAGLLGGAADVFMLVGMCLFIFLWSIIYHRYSYKDLQDFGGSVVLAGGGSASIDLAEQDDSGSDGADQNPAALLHLARAYVDMGKQKLALDILQKVREKGSVAEQKQAEDLLIKIN